MYSRADVGPVDTFGVPTGADVAATKLVLVDAEGGGACRAALEVDAAGTGGGGSLVGCFSFDCSAINWAACFIESSAAVAAAITPLASWALYRVSNLLTGFLHLVYKSLASLIWCRTACRSLYSCS